MHPNIARLRLKALQMAPPATATPEQVVARLGAVQAQDYPGALWSIGLRTASCTRKDVEQAIAQRTIVRTWPMRGTLHFVPAADVKWMVQLMATRIIKRAAGRNKQLELDEAVLKRSRALITRALARDKVLTRPAIFALLDKAGIIPTGQRGVHILQLFCMEGTLCHGPHDEKLPTFVLLDEWVSRSTMIEADEALATITRRYFTGHGPATLRDFIWWSGLTVAEARRGLELAQMGLERFTHDGVEYWMGEGLLDSALEQRAHLLPGFDEYLLGYKDRSAVLAPAHSDRVAPGGNGVFMSTVVFDGAVKGTWKRATRGSGVTMDLTPFARMTARDKQLFDVPAKRFGEFHGASVTVRWAPVLR